MNADSYVRDISALRITDAEEAGGKGRTHSRRQSLAFAGSKVTAGAAFGP
jgi:hypothetical protein